MRLKELNLLEQEDDFIRSDLAIRLWLRSALPNYRESVIEIVDGKVTTTNYFNFDFSVRPKISQLPVEFGSLSKGRFDIAELELTTLRGCPPVVDGYFNCNHNKLGDLQYAPKIVRGDFMCNNAGLKTLMGVSDYIEEIHGTLYIADNTLLKSGGLGLLLIKGLKDIKYTDAWHRKYYDALDIIKKYLGRPDDIFECQSELIETGLEDYAQL